MFNVGGPEVLVIFLVALIVLGPQQLPKAMKTFGSVMGEIRKVSNSFQAEMRSAMDSVVDASATEKPQSGSMADATPSSTATATSTIEEVVARNDEPAEVGEAPGSSTEEVGARPAIDPADRAAG
ncbi:MAG: twin-arginine translocase TatA/TatE family subunit [Acidimicrobiales bacterium]|nr:twin-arginine translocase TatA/TatE family subunit [Acidimicrobiales bacterium]